MKTKEFLTESPSTMEKSVVATTRADGAENALCCGLQSEKFVIRYCSIEGCSNKATTILSSSWFPGDQWNVCDSCQWLVDPNAVGWDENGFPAIFGCRGPRAAVSCPDNANNGRMEKPPACVLVETTMSSKNNGNVLPQNTPGKLTNEKTIAATTRHDFEKVLSFRKLTGARVKKCDVDGCSLAACSLWSIRTCGSSDTSARKRVYVCVDCQEVKFGGWPSLEGLLGKGYMSEEKREVIARLCSVQANPSMPPAFVKEIVILKGVFSDPIPTDLLNE